MYPFKRILVPTDFSLCAEAALRHALYLAQRYKAEVHLLHIKPPLLNDGAHGKKMSVEVWPDKVTEPRPGMPAYTEHWHNLLLHRVIAYHADPVAAVLNYSSEKDIDFIVMGAHGDRGTGHYLNLGVGSAFLGHTTEQVVRHANKPVFRVGMRKGRSPELIRHILVPMDFSPLAHLALAYAKDLASFYDARLYLLNVQDLHAANHAESPEAAAGSASATEHQEQVRDELIEVFKKTKGPDVSAGFFVLEGRPDRKIRSFILDKAVDMVVLGAHSEQGKDVLGIVAEQVVRKAACPVLTVRKDKVEKDTSWYSKQTGALPSFFIFQ